MIRKRKRGFSHNEPQSPHMEQNMIRKRKRGFSHNESQSPHMEH